MWAAGAGGAAVGTTVASSAAAAAAALPQATKALSLRYATISRSQMNSLLSLLPLDEGEGVANGTLGHVQLDLVNVLALEPRVKP